MRRFLILTCAGLLGGPAAQAQSLADHPRVREAVNLVEAWLDAERAYGQIPSIAGALVHDQEVLWAGASGYADPEAGIQASPATVYSICSITKLFTAIGIMQLRDAGLLTLDDPVAELLPWFDIRERWAGSGPVTVRGLLTHSSGLPRESDYPYWVDPFDFPDRGQVIERLGRQEMLYPADRFYQYSNLGFVLAGEIVETLSSEAYADYVLGRILTPLGMDDTWPDVGAYPEPDRIAAGYGALMRDGTRKRLPSFKVEGISAAAGFASTVEDLARFALWQFRLLGSGADEILSANTLREMHRVQWLDEDWDVARGLGFGVYREDGVTYVGHNGLCPGYRSSIQVDAGSRTAGVIMMNAIGPSPSALAIEALRVVGPAIAEAIDEQLAYEEGLLADDYGPATLPPEFERFTGTYDEQPWGGESLVVSWQGGLAIVWLPTPYPADDLVLLEHVEGNTFRRLREDGSLGEEYVFVENERGDVIGLRYHSNTYPRIAPGRATR